MPTSKITTGQAHMRARRARDVVGAFDDERLMLHFARALHVTVVPRLSVGYSPRPKARLKAA